MLYESLNLLGSLMNSWVENLKEFLMNLSQQKSKGLIELGSMRGKLFF